MGGVRQLIGDIWRHSHPPGLDVPDHAFLVLSSQGVHSGPPKMRQHRTLRAGERKRALPRQGPVSTSPSGGCDAERAWKRAGIDELVWTSCPHHAFRAGFQSGLRRLGADTEAVEYLVGHSRGDVRERYVDPDSLPLVAAVALVPEIGVTTDERTGLVHDLDERRKEKG